jgi:hypothetical protein
MLRFNTSWILPIALTAIGLGSNVAIAQAQTTTNFDVKYNTLFTLVPRSDLGEGMFRATITGNSSDAAFGLTNFESNTYGKLVEATPTTQSFEFNANPAQFGLKDLPMLGDRYFGGSNELFGKASDRAKVDFGVGTVAGGGTITLTKGTGLLENASGQITFTQNDKLDPTAPPGTPVKGEAILKFSVTTPRSVPEPTGTTSLIGIGLTGAVLMLKRHHRKGSIGG